MSKRVLRTSILLSCFVGCVGVANAAPEVIETSLNMDLKQQIELNWVKISKHRHSLDCYPTGKSDGYDELGGETIAGAAIANGVGQISSAVTSASYGFGIGTVSATAVAKSGSQDGLHEIRVELRDDVPTTSYQHKGDSKCVGREYHWKVRSHVVEGDFKFSFKMPANTWVVKASLEKFSGQGVTTPKNLEGDLHAGLYDANFEEDAVYLWAKPGDTVTFRIKISVPSAGGTLVGFTLKLNTLKTAGAELPKDQWKAVRASFAQISNQQRDKIAKSADGFMLAGSRVLQSPTVAQELSAGMGIEEYKKFLDWLFKIANSSEQFAAEDTEHVKAMAAAVGYKLAVALMNDISVFCHEVELEMPLSNRKVRTSGFIAANYYMNRDTRRLDAIRFPEIRFYLEQLVKWEQAGLKYSDVALSDEKYGKLKAGFIKIRRSSEIAFDVYGDLQRGLDKTMSLFKTNGASQQLNEQIRAELLRMSGLQKEFNSAFQNEFGKFTTRNPTRMQSSEVLASLNSLEERSRNLSKTMLSQVKLIALTHDDSDTNIIGVMTSLFMHQIAIFDEPLKSKFAEPIRTAFRDDSQVKELRSSYNQCIGGVR